MLFLLFLLLSSFIFFFEATENAPFTFNEHFEFPLLNTTQYVKLTVGGVSLLETSFMGRVFLPIAQIAEQMQAAANAAGGDVNAVPPAVKYKLLPRGKGEKVSGEISLVFKLSKEDAKDTGHQVCVCVCVCVGAWVGGYVEQGPIEQCWIDVSDLLNSFILGSLLPMMRALSLQMVFEAWSPKRRNASLMMVLTWICRISRIALLGWVILLRAWRVFTVTI